MVYKLEVVQRVYGRGFTWSLSLPRGDLRARLAVGLSSSLVTWKSCTSGAQARHQVGRLL